MGSVLISLTWGASTPNWHPHNGVECKNGEIVKWPMRSPGQEDIHHSDLICTRNISDLVLQGIPFPLVLVLGVVSYSPIRNDEISWTRGSRFRGVSRVEKPNKLAGCRGARFGNGYGSRKLRCSLNLFYPLQKCQTRGSNLVESRNPEMLNLKSWPHFDNIPPSLRSVACSSRSMSSIEARTIHCFGSSH